MSLEHKAFIFDYDKFNADLKLILIEALTTANIHGLINFINTNIELCKDPYEGNSLDEDWESMIERKEPHQYGDFALTKFYDPSEDIGLGYNWELVQEILFKEGLNHINPTLGETCGLDSNVFDPGRVGSYFQSPKLVSSNLSLINSLISKNSNLAYDLELVKQMLERALELNKGLYITF